MVGYEDDARAALAAKGEAERRLAQAADCPPWRHAAFALVMAALVASPAVALPLRMAVVVGVFVAIVLLVRSDRRRTGLFVSGYRRGRTLLVTLPLLAVDLALYLVCVRAGLGGDEEMVIILAGATFLVNLVASIAWQRMFERELGA